MYDNLQRIQKMDDPKAREVKDLGRSNKKIRVRRKVSKSISLSKLNFLLSFMKIFGLLIFITVLGVAIYYGLQVYLGQ